MSFFKYSLGNHWTKILDSTSPPPASVTESALRVRKGGEKDTAREERGHNRFQEEQFATSPLQTPQRKGRPHGLPSPHPTPVGPLKPTEVPGAGHSPHVPCTLECTHHLCISHFTQASGGCRPNSTLPRRKPEVNGTSGVESGKQLNPATSEQRHNCASQADTATELVHFFKMGHTV